MYKVEKNEKIGEYIGKLISRKFGRDRQFAIAYIKLRDRLEDEPDSDEIQRVANKVCQIKKGGKGIQITDLPLFAELLEVSIDSLLSAGKVLKPASTRMTNYSVAFSKDKKTWKEYVERPDKLILNEDEYGKNVIDYALEFGNYAFLKYLMDNDYIYFIDDDRQKYWGTFAAGTKIERRMSYDHDLLDVRMKECDSLRTNLIALALKNQDYDVLGEMKAREIPSLYEGTYFYSKALDFKKYYNQQMMEAIPQASDDILIYFSEEFEIETNRKAICRYTFPYLGKLIEMVLKNECKATAKMLKNALRHNIDVLETLKKIADISVKSFDYIAQYMDDKTIQERVMGEFHFYDENDTVAFHTGIIKAENFQGLFSNVIRVNASSKDKYVMSLIEDVNASYDQIKNFNYKEG